MYFDHTLRALAVNLAPGVALIFVQGTDNKSKIKSKSKSKNLDYEYVREKVRKIRMSLNSCVHSMWYLAVCTL